MQKALVATSAFFIGEQPGPIRVYIYTMADVHNKQTRSYNMSMIKGAHTKPENAGTPLLHGRGYRYKLHDKILPGKPDIVLPRYNTIIFIHGLLFGMGTPTANTT